MPELALSDKTLRLVRCVFRSDQQSAAVAILEAECGSNLPFMAAATAESIERVRFAVLKMSGGELSELRRALSLANTDWRDILVAAHFADDLLAHVAWFDERIAGDTANGDAQ